MDRRTQENVRWLDHRYRAGLADGRYFAHEPIYGIGCAHSEPNHAVRLARTYSIFRRLSQMRFDTLLDVGGAEGYHANLARRLLAATAVTSDVSFEADLRAREFFGLPAVMCDARLLPYQDEAFDVVLCCEVLEHVSDPVAVMCEAARVARRYAVFSTEQVCSLPRQREIHLLLVDREQPHAEVNWFLPEDSALVLGDSVAWERQAVITERCAELILTGQEALSDEIRGLVLEMTRVGEPTAADHGILVIKRRALLHWWTPRNQVTRACWTRSCPRRSCQASQ